MATNITVFDLENYPDNNKTVTVDVTKVTPVGSEGDEKWVLSTVTSAFSSISNSTTIQDIYVQEIKAGWAKSSGLVGTGGNFSVNTTPEGKTLGIKMDASSKTYYIELDTGVSIGGDTIAADMETKIRAIPNTGAWATADDKLAYMNASVEFTNGKFYIISGTVSPFYTGANRSSVVVTASGGDSAYGTLGFNLSVDSESVASTAVNESLVSSSYTTDNSPLSVDTLTVSAGDALAITDGTNTDYFMALDGTTATSIVVAVSGTNGYVGIANSYTLIESKVQVLRMQDPDQAPVAIYDEVDEILRWGIKSIVNQIDFSS